MKLSNFSGGLNIRKDASLIDISEAVGYSNIDNTGELLKSIRNYSVTSQSVNNWFYLFNTVWQSSNLERDYIEYRGKLYYTENSSTAKKVVGDATKELGIIAPTTKLTSVQGAAGTISGSDAVLQYVYTYYDSSEGVESAPSPVSDELSLTASHKAELTAILPSGNASANIVRLYRTGAGATEFTLIAEIAAGVATYSDNIATVDAIGTILDTLDNQAPRAGLRHLVQAYGILFAAVGSRVYYTKIGLPDAWPSLNFIDVNNDVTGLFPIQDGLLIFTRNGLSILVGTSSANWQLLKVTTEQGCTNHKSCKIVKNIPVWVSEDGICSWQNGGVNLVSEDKLGNITLDVVNTAVYKGQYYVCQTDGNLFAMDLRFGSICFKDFDFVGDITNIGLFGGVLYGVVAGKVVTMFTAELLAFSYLSPELTEGDASMVKMYNNIYVKADVETMIVRVLIDGKQVLQQELKDSDIFDLKVPQEKQRGSSIQFQLDGIGTIKEIEYKPAGRENGR